jgi:hypothetical protein
VQKALTGRKLVLQELYKYYSWSPEAEGASRHQKLTMSAENFVKLATDAKVRKRHFLRHLYIKCIILPRQARDKHRENSKKGRFLAAPFEPGVGRTPGTGKEGGACGKGRGGSL